MSTYNDIEVGKVSSTLKVIIDRVYVIGDGEEHIPFLKYTIEAGKMI